MKIKRSRSSSGPAAAPRTVRETHPYSRDEILARIRSAQVPPVTQAQWAFEPGRPGDVDVFVERLVDYRAGVRVCGEPDLADVVGELLTGTQTLAVPADVPTGWLTRYSSKVLMEPVTRDQLDLAGVSVLTGCAVAIAQTGTIVLDGGPLQGRRMLTLLPDHHVCVVRIGQILDGVPEALAELSDPTRPLTFISGPSATSDIELNRVEGVHGPRRLDVVVVR